MILVCCAWFCVVSPKTITFINLVDVVLDSEYNTVSNDRSSSIIKPKYKKSIGITIAITIAALLSFSTISRVFADNVVDDVASTYGGTTVNVVAGSSFTVNYWIIANSALGSPSGCDASDGSSVTVSISSTFASPTSRSFSNCGQTFQQPVTFTIPSTAAATTYTVTASAADSSGVYNTNPATFSINVAPPPPKQLIFTSPTPSPITTTATSSAGAVVTYATPTAAILDPSTNPPTQTPVPVTCNPPSGSTFAIGQTTVTCTASSSDPTVQPRMIQTSFIVTVNPQNLPPRLQLPTDTTVEATGPTGATATYTASATDPQTNSPLTVTCNPPSGSTFALGSNTVTCSATNSAGTSSGSFHVIVQDTTGPTISNIPQNIVAEATSNLGAPVTYATPTASDLVDGVVTVTCGPASGSTFALDQTTTVTCTATDAHNNPTSGGFTVQVRDTKAPTLTLPSTITKDATSSAGAIVTYTATSTDLVDGSVPVTCTPTSGSTFPLNTNTVTCSATDAHTNKATGTFTILVHYPTSSFSGFLQPVNTDGTSTFKIGSTIPIKFKLTFAGTPPTTPCTCKISFAQKDPTSGVVNEDVYSAPADSGSLFRYDSTNQNYIYNLATKTLTKGTYTVTAALDDGTTRFVNFDLR